MVMSISIAVVLLIAVAALVRFTSLKVWHALVCGFSGLALAGTKAGPPLVHVLQFLATAVRHLNP